MKKRAFLATFLVISGVSLVGCSVGSGNENSGSGTNVSTEANTPTSVRDSSEANSSAEISESATVENSSANNEEKSTSSTEKTTSSQKENETVDKEDQDEELQETVPVQKYSEEEKEKASQEFLEWAVSRAEEGGMAVTDNYFGHGASGSGDWYAVTEDGEIQVQEQDPTKELPGYDAYDIHALGGVVFYTSLSGVIGYDDESDKTQGGAGGGRNYSEVADPEYPLHKYLLGDNGVVYELIGSVDELSAYQDGYGLYDDDGKNKLYEEEFTFKVSDDQDAQKEWTRVLKNHQ